MPKQMNPWDVFGKDMSVDERSTAVTQTPVDDQYRSDLPDNKPEHYKLPYAERMKENLERMGLAYLISRNRERAKYGKEPIKA